MARSRYKDKFVAFLDEVGVPDPEEVSSKGMAEIRQHGQIMRSMITAYITAAKEMEERLEEMQAELDAEREPKTVETEVEVVDD